MRTFVRYAAAATVILAAAATPGTASADTYRWCAQYGGKSGATNCYFRTLEQCRAAISGLGGFCQPNNFYTGPDEPRRKRRH